MTAWVPVVRSAVGLFRAEPTADLVRRCGLAHCPGIRLTANRLAVTDSQGYFTEFWVGEGGLTYAFVIDPDGYGQWLQELRVLPENDDWLDEAARRR